MVIRDPVKKRLWSRAKLSRRRNAKRAILSKLKAKPCFDCGGTFPWYCMDFDHVRGKKLRDIAGIVASNYGARTMIDEIRKCDLVCSNCHRARTYKRKHNAGRTDEQMACLNEASPPCQQQASLFAFSSADNAPHKHDLDLNAVTPARGIGGRPRKVKL